MGVAMRFRFISLACVFASTAVALLITAAVAGSGVGGVFNLGQTNTVNGRTLLQGTTATQQLYVANTSTSAGSTGAFGRSDSGTGVSGQTKSRIGVRAAATGTTGSNYGLYATTASGVGLAGFFRNTGTTPDLTYGTALRVWGAGAKGTEISSRDHAAGAGEFIGYVGVTGASSLADGGAGVLALAGAGDYGIYALSASPDGQAGFFQNPGGTAVRALSSGATVSDFDDYGYTAGGQFAGRTGVVAASSSSGGFGVVAVQGKGNYALVAIGDVRVNGDLLVNGALYKGSGSFRIDHPLDPANKYLSHSFVESPDMMNVYNGNVVTDAMGKAVVELPKYFNALNRDPRYQLTVIGSPATAYVLEEVHDNTFSIKTSEPDVKVSWQVTGIRQDAFARVHPIIVEEEKAVADRGHYLHPKELGMSESLAIGAGIGLQASISQETSAASSD